MTLEIFQPHQRPTTMDKAELLQFLAWTRELIEHDDSMEGSVTYGCSDEPGQYDVHAFLRTGNSMGQGGVTLLQAPEPVAAPVAQPAKPGTYEVAWVREIEADDPVEAATKALQLIQGQPITLVNAVEVAPDTKFEIDGREIDPENPPLCTAQVFGGSRIDPPEYCDEVGTHWDEHDNPWCDKHSAQPDPFDGEDI